jgi:hypothetical protein
MAQDEKYGQVDIPGVPDDEPVFILRGRDQATPDTIRDYADIALEGGSPPEFCQQAVELAKKIEAWQQEDPDNRMKIAD